MPVSSAAATEPHETVLLKRRNAEQHPCVHHASSMFVDQTAIAAIATASTIDDIVTSWGFE
jgi:hypothetical protein